MTTFRLPDLGEGLQDAEIVSWHVSAGDRVVADQPLVSVETDKAVVEVPAPWSGRVTVLHGVPGDTIEIGAALAELDLEDEGKDAGTVVGELPGSETIGTPVQAAPAVRALARRQGVDLSKIKGTGPGGAITSADVEAAGSAAGAKAFVPLRGPRRAMARNMARAHAEVAPTTVSDEAVVEGWPPGTDVTMRLVRAMSLACQAEPGLNAWYDGERQARLLHDHIDLGFAVNTDEGLFVPVLRDVGNREEADLRSGLDSMKRDVAARTIPAGELRGQTITLSNFGMLGGRLAALVIMPPQVAILGAGRITAEPRVVDGKIAVARVLPLSLTFDHRAVTGAEATRFLMAIIEDLQK